MKRRWNVKPDVERFGDAVWTERANMDGTGPIVVAVAAVDESDNAGHFRSIILASREDGEAYISHVRAMMIEAFPPRIGRKALPPDEKRLREREYQRDYYQRMKNDPRFKAKRSAGQKVYRRRVAEARKLDKVDA